MMTKPPSLETGPWIWTPADLAKSEDWTWNLSRRSIAEINEAVRSVKALNIKLEKITKTLFKLPSLSDDFKTMRQQLYQGRGLCLIRGIPVDDYSDDDLALIHWGIGAHIGLGVSQSYRGDKIGKVMDMSHTGDTRRPYRSPGALIMHVDPVDVVALLCLRKARSGGESLVASSIAIYNTILKERPELINPLLRGYHYFHSEIQGTGGNPISENPVPIFGECEGRLECMYVSFSINRAIKEQVEDLSDQQIEALEVLNEVASRKNILFEMDLEKGDIQYLNNRLLLHGRRDYVDFEGNEKKRQMLRLWLKMEEWPRLPACMYSRRAYDEDGGIPVARKS